MTASSNQPNSEYGDSPVRPGPRGVNGTVDHSHNGMIRKGDLLVNGRYKVLQVVYGGMGVVYKCAVTSTDNGVVGLKTVQTDGAMSEKAINDMLNNYKLVGSLTHEHIVRVHLPERDDKRRQWFSVMDWVEGVSLETRLQHTEDGRLSAEETIRLLTQVADALDYAHTKKVVHRDVKCENIMVKTDGDALLIDFGIARRAPVPIPTGQKGLDGTGASDYGVIPEADVFTGTSGYQSPEQWKGKDATAKSDQYSLAVTAYRCLSGHLPFWNNNQGELEEMVLNRPVPLVETLSDEVNAVLAKALSKEASGRYANCGEFASELANALEEGTGKDKVTKPQKEDKDIDLMEFYVLAGTVDKYYEEYKATEWNRGQMFDVHLDEFEKAYIAASGARKDNKLAVANDFLKKADAEWRWIKDNSLLRTKIITRLATVQQARRTAEGRQAERYARTLFQEALDEQEKATERFEAGDFREAVACSDVAESKFEYAAKVALESHVCSLEDAINELVKQGRFPDCDGKLRELAALDEKKHQELAALVSTAKSERIRNLGTTIQKEIEQGHFNGLEADLQELSALDSVKGRHWEGVVLTAKSKRIQELKKIVNDNIARLSFGEVEKILQELSQLDPAAAEECKARVQTARNAYIKDLENRINDSVAKWHFEEAMAAVRELIPLDGEKGRQLEAFVVSRKADCIAELETGIANALAQKDFDGAVAFIDKLRMLDKVKADEQMQAVVAAKSATIGEIEKLAEKAINDCRFEDAEELVRRIDAMDKGKADKWRQKIRIAKAERIQELERLIKGAIAQEHFKEALALALELRKLDAQKADELEKSIRVVKDMIIRDLRQVINDTMARGDYGKAGETAQTLKYLDEELADEIAKTIQTTKQAEIQRLEEEISKAIELKQFDKAAFAVQKLKPLDAEKAEKWEKAVQNAKTEEIGRLKTTIDERVRQKQFPEAVEAIRQLAQWDPQAAGDLSKTAETLKSAYLFDLEHSIGEAVIGKRFDDAYAGIDALTKLDRVKADKWRKIVDDARANHIQTLEKNIENAMLREQFDVAESLILQLERLSPEKAETLRKTIQTQKKDKIKEIEHRIQEFLDRGKFKEANDMVQTLALLDKNEFDEWVRIIADVKDDYIVQQKKEIASFIEQRVFDKADIIRRELSELDNEEGQKQADIISVAKDAEVQRLEKVIYDAVVGKRFDEANVALQELDKLNYTKAEEWREFVKKATNDHVIHLKEVVDECIKQKRFAEARQAVVELYKLDSTSAQDCNAAIKSAEAKDRQEKLDNFMRLAKRIGAVVGGICLVLFVIWAVKNGGMWLRRQKVLSAITAIHGDLLSRRPESLNWQELNRGNDTLERMLGKTAALPPSQIYGVLETCEGKKRGWEDFRKGQEELKRKISSLEDAPSLKAEWEARADDLLPSSEDRAGLEKAVKRYEDLLKTRDERLIHVIMEFGGIMRAMPEILVNLAQANREKSLNSLQAFIGDAHYILFWYDERNTGGLPFHVDKAWVGLRGQGKAYSGDDAAEKCRQDALEQAQKLKAMMVNSDQWASWCQRLWKADAMLEENGWVAARKELDDLDKAIEGFGVYQDKFRIALATVSRGIMQKEAGRITAEVARCKGETENVVQQIKERFATEEEKRKITDNHGKAMAVCKDALADQAMSGYLVTCRKDMAWLEEINTALNILDEVWGGCNELDKRVAAFNQQREEMSTTEMKRHLDALNMECVGAKNKLDKIAEGVFNSQKQYLERKLEEHYKNVLAIIKSSEGKILDAHLASLKEIMGQMEERSSKLVLEGHFQRAEAFESEKYWYHGKADEAKKIVAAMGNEAFVDEEARNLRQKEAEALQGKIVGMAGEAEKTLLPALQEIHRIESACGELEKKLQALLLECEKINLDITSETLKKMEKEVATIQKEQQVVAQWLGDFQKNETAAKYAFVPSMTADEVPEMSGRLAKRLAAAEKGIDGLVVTLIRSNLVIEKNNKLVELVPNYEKKCAVLSDERKGKQEEFDCMYQDIQNAYNEILKIKAISDEGKWLLDGRPQQRERVEAVMDRARKAHEASQAAFAQMIEFDGKMNTLKGLLKELDVKIEAVRRDGENEANVEAMINEYGNLKNLSDGMVAVSKDQKERLEGVVSQGTGKLRMLFEQLVAAFNRHEAEFNKQVEALGVMLRKLEGMGYIPARDVLECHSAIQVACKMVLNSPLSMEQFEKREQFEERKNAVQKKYRESVMDNYHRALGLSVYHALACQCHVQDEEYRLMTAQVNKGGVRIVPDERRPELIKTLTAMLEEVIDAPKEVGGEQWRAFEAKLRRMKGLDESTQMKDGLKSGQTAFSSAGVGQFEWQRRFEFLKKLRDMLLTRQIGFESWREFLTAGLTDVKTNAEESIQQEINMYYGKLSDDLSVCGGIYHAKKGQVLVLQDIAKAEIASGLQKQKSLLDESAKAFRVNPEIAKELQAIEETIKGLQDRIHAGKTEIARLGGRLPGINNYGYETRMLNDFRTATSDWNKPQRELEAYQAEWERLQAFWEFLPSGMEIHRKAEQLTMLYSRLGRGENIQLQQVETVYRELSGLCQKAKNIRRLSDDIKSLVDDCLKYEEKFYNNALEVLQDE